MLNGIALRILVLLTGLLLVGMAGADQIHTQPQADPKAPVVDNTPDPTLTPRDITEREQEYLSALKVCEPLLEAERQNCIKAVKGKYGLM
jgi:hypothetical protein